jgi:hypothetical protein
MRLLNAFCRLLEVAATQEPAVTAAVPSVPAPALDGETPLLLFPELGPQERRRAGGAG